MTQPNRERTKRFAPPRNAKGILKDLAEPGDWAYISGHWWTARSFNAETVTLTRPGVGRETLPRTLHTHVNGPLRWVKGSRSE